MESFIQHMLEFDKKHWRFFQLCKRVLISTVALPSIEISSGRVPGDSHKTEVTGQSEAAGKCRISLHQELEGVQSCASKWECHILQRWLKVHSLWASAKIWIYVAGHEMPKPSKTIIGILNPSRLCILMVPKSPKPEKRWESSKVRLSEGLIHALGIPSCLCRIGSGALSLLLESVSFWRETSDEQQAAISPVKIL